MYRSELQDFIRQLLTDWNVQDMYIDRTIDAVEFQYTYWPDPENRTARQQEFIHVSVVDDILQEKKCFNGMRFLGSRFKRDGVVSTKSAIESNYFS